MTLPLDPHFLAAISRGPTTWEFPGLPRGLWLFVALVLLAASLALIVLLYRQEGRLTRVQRWTLTLVRVLAFAVIVFILTDPQKIQDVELTNPGKAFIVIDTSQSMGLQDTYEVESQKKAVERATELDLDEKPSRLSLVHAALKRHETIQRLEERNDVRLYAFGEELTPLAHLDALGDKRPEAGETRIGEALASAVDGVDAEPPTAVILISDGHNTGGIAPIEAIQDSLRTRRVPVHTVGVGHEALTSNRQLVELSAPEVAEPGFPIEIEALVQTSGIREAFTATLTRSDHDGARKTVVARKGVRPSGATYEVRLKFIDTLNDPGRYVYRLEVPLHPREVTRQDNHGELTVSASEIERQVLLVAGEASPEFIFLRNFLLRDRGVAVSCWLAAADTEFLQDGDVVIQRLPLDAKELLPYGAVILLDPPPKALTQNFLKSLKTFVTEQGGGLVYVAGEAYTPSIARGVHFGVLRSLLPVVLSPAPLASFYKAPWRPRITDQGKLHPACRLVEDPRENEALWDVLQPFYFCYPATKLKPAAVSLCYGLGDNLLAALQRLGPGKVLYLGTDDFHFWRASGLDIYERFWSSIVRFVSVIDKKVHMERIVLETDRDAYQPGESVRILAHYGTNAKARAAPLEAVIEWDAERALSGAASNTDDDTDERALRNRRWRVRLRPDEAKEGQALGIFPAGGPGFFRVRLGAEAETTFEVRAVSSELQDSTPDFGLLATVAEQTGATFRELSAIEQLPEAIAEGKVTEIIGRQKRAGWDTPSWLLLFAALLTVEWILRKLWNLS